MESFGDRRHHPRFDITGTFWVALHLSGDSRLRNISTTGALVEVPAGQPWSSVRSMLLTLPTGRVTIIGIVKRQAQTASDPDRQLLGLEFIQMSPAARAELQLYLGDAAAR